MKIGFTGTRNGMSDHQKKEVAKVMEYYKGHHTIGYIVHGGCVGADMDFHLICLGHARHVRPGYSSVNPGDLSFRGDFSDADLVYEARPYLQRNRDIVDECGILIACPYNDIQKGGTWSTIKYAEKTGKSVIIIKPE